MKYFIIVGLLSVAYYEFRIPISDFVLERVQKNCSEIYQNHTQWYTINNKVLPRKYSNLFIQSHQDEETKQFLEESCKISNFILTEIGHLIVRFVLGLFIRRTSLNGWLGRGSMFVLSTQQFRNLLDIDETWHAHSLIDLGAGNGRVTAQMAVHFDEVYATEASEPMVWRLEELGYTVLGIDDWHKRRQKYDVISCLNLLDRCDHPVTLLRNIKKSLEPEDGRLLLALVLPFRPFVEFGGFNNRPIEKLDISGKTAEEQIMSLIVNVFRPAGFEIERFTKLPYLSQGNLKLPFFKLTDFVFVLRPIKS